MSERLFHLRQFYDLLERLEDRVGGRRQLARCNGRMVWPDRGVYFFFEDGEARSDSGSGPRVVRVGTHALKHGSRTSLWGRLAQHRGIVKHGGGNHRGSVFRKLVGAAISARQPSLAVGTWDHGQSAPRAVRAREHELECRVSDAIGRMLFLWLEVPDEPAPDSLRGVVERNAIALLSNHDRCALDPPSDAWLGNWCPRDKVRSSGLWNNNHVNERYEPAFLDVLERLIATTRTGWETGRDGVGWMARQSNSEFGVKFAPPIDHETWEIPARGNLTDTLLIVPCSKSKEDFVGRKPVGPRIGNRIPASLAERLDRARTANRRRAGVDERTLAPAWQRYSGRFYQAADGALAEAVRRRLHLLILSGGYGVLLAREPIGLYDAILKTSWWPERVLESVLAGYARRHRLNCMRAFVSRTTSYRQVVERAEWKAAGVNDAVLLMPAGGSQDSVSRAQGEAFAALLSGATLDQNWRSSAGLPLICRKLV